MKAISITYNQAYYDEIHRERQPKHSIPDPFIVYAGSLSAQIRPPEYVLSLLGALYQKKVRYKACFYSRGCSEVVRDYSDKTASQIEWKDYVSPDELLSIYHDAHFLLNIGNLAEDVLPSKLIQYISTGKPIIHISFSQKDACLPYLERYENCVIINTEEPFEENVSKLTSFLRTNQSLFCYRPGFSGKHGRMDLPSIAELMKRVSPCCRASEHLGITVARRDAQQLQLPRDPFSLPLL